MSTTCAELNPSQVKTSSAAVAIAVSLVDCLRLSSASEF